MCLVACGGSGGGDNDPGVHLSGRITYDFVPHQADSFGLDYDAIERRPVRGATVQVIRDDSSILASGQTDDDGEYSFTLAANQDVLVRARAEIVMDGAPSWDFAVSDNTNDNALYVLEGSLAQLGTTNQTRNLNANSGWGGVSYSSERAAAPFAILDTVYGIVEKFLEVDPDIQFPPAEVRWSESNVSVPPDDPMNPTGPGGIADGQITTSSYRPLGSPGGGNMYLLGDENVDTDEYDPHIIVHEWGHYFEDQMSRSDSIGGSHRFIGGIVDVLDMRVAFSEGWGNALSAIILDDPVVRDTGGQQQQGAFGFDIEDNDVFSPDGWYSEASVHNIIYDLHDDQDDGVDTVSLGLGPIYSALTSEEYVGQDTLTSIFSFLTQIKLEAPLQSEVIDTIAASEGVNGIGYLGEGETNFSAIDGFLPVYKGLELNIPTRVCSDSLFGEYNKVLNRVFLLIEFPITDLGYTIDVELATGNPLGNPEVVLWGDILGEGFGRYVLIDEREDPDGTSESFPVSGSAFVLELFEPGNVDEEDNTGGEACFDVTVSAN